MIALPSSVKPKTEKKFRETLNLSWVALNLWYSSFREKFQFDCISNAENTKDERASLGKVSSFRSNGLGIRNDREDPDNLVMENKMQSFGEVPYSSLQENFPCCIHACTLIL